MEHYLYEEFTNEGIKSYEYHSFEKMYREHNKAFKLEEYCMDNYPELFLINSSQFYENFSTMTIYHFMTSEVVITNLDNYDKYKHTLCHKCKRPILPQPDELYPTCAYCISDNQDLQGENNEYYAG